MGDKQWRPRLSSLTSKVLYCLWICIHGRAESELKCDLTLDEVIQSACRSLIQVESTDTFVKEFDKLS